MRRRAPALAFAIAFAVTAPVAASTPLAFVDDETVAHLYWPQVLDGMPIPFRISDAGTPDVDLAPTDPAIDEFEAMALAFAAWEQVPGVPIEFDLQPTATNAAGFDGENVIFFADLGNVGYGGVALITFDNTTGEILDADIHMNDHNIRWLTSGNDVDGEPQECPCEGVDPGAVFTNDIQGLATHEIGHVLGLDHSGVGIRESATTPTMYPRGIWNVPGDGSRPANSRYRTIELDDEIGIQSIYPPAGWDAGTGTIEGVVHDAADAPIFGAHVVARRLSSGEEVGAMSGVLDGPYAASAYRLPGLPPDDYEVRVEPLVGEPPGFVSRFNFGGIAQALIPAKFPDAVDLSITYHRLTDDPAAATPVALAAGGASTVDFRPAAAVDAVPRFLRLPRPFSVAGALNLDVTGPLDAARFVHAVDGADQPPIDLAIGAPGFTVDVPLLPAGSLVTWSLELETTAGETLETPERSTQVGLSGEPIVLMSMQGGARLSAVDTRTLFDVDESPTVLSFPLGIAFHAARHGVYAADFGLDRISFVPLSDGVLPPLDVQPFDTDGDRLLDVMEPFFGTDAADPDTDGDLRLDGDEISRRDYVHPGFSATGVTVLGACLADDGSSPMGSPLVNIALYNETAGAWETGVMALTPSGRFRLHLPADVTWSLAFYNAQSGQWMAGSPDFGGTSGQTLSLGATTLPLPPLAPPTPESGTDPLDLFDGAIGLFRDDVTTIPLESGADAYGVVLSPGDQRYLYVTGSGSGRVYRVDTTTDAIVDEVAVGAFPKGIAITPDGSRLFVALNGDDAVAVLDADPLALLTTIPVAGAAHDVEVTGDGSRVLVTTGGATDLGIIDVATGSLVAGLSSGLNGLVFLSRTVPGFPSLIAGDFQVGDHELAVVDPIAGTVQTIDLGADVSTTAGIAVHPDGARGYVMHYLEPELLEFDVASGSVLRRLDLPFIDTRDLRLIEGITSPDCNANGVRDDQDVAAGTSLDDDGNGVPDECDGPPCPGDTNDDGVVDIDDVVNVVLDFGSDGTAHGGDVDGSGVVDIDDIVLVILEFGSACP